MAMEPERVLANIEKSHGRGLPEFFKLPEVMKPKGETPLAIVGGGPSLAETFDEMRGFQQIMVCGSAHDYLVEQGFAPRYCVVLDPDPITANYLSKPHPLCTYLVASQCDDAVFGALKHSAVAVWHCAGVGMKIDEDTIFRKSPRIGGGCTVTLRAINIGIILGYGNQHFFGFDSCVRPDRTHAYDVEPVEGIVDVRMPGSNRVFYAASYHLAQAQQFQDALRNHGHLFTPTVHGNGLIAEIMKVGQQRAKLKQEKV